ncbi:MAG: trypsin-like peptidase domain-containing protein [Gemmataceae bacterium]
MRVPRYPLAILAQTLIWATVALAPAVLFAQPAAVPLAPLEPASTRPAAASEHLATTPERSARAWSLRSTPVVDVVKRVKDAVVNIHSERSVKALSSEELGGVASTSRVNGMGSGIVIDPRGYIITNQHVVEDVSALRVRLADGTTLNARVLARDVETDLALLKVTPSKPLPTVRLGTAKDLQVGETTIAIGNAFGYDHTVTVGIVSAVGRDVTLNREVKYKSLIQTDAAINPGNSGGPLFNMDGELVGVNVAIRAGAQGIGFAIPVDQMITMAGVMLSRTREGLAPLPLVVRDEVTDKATSRQVIVERVESGGEKLGVKPGDVVTRIGDQPVSSSLDVHRALIDAPAGTKFDLVVRRDGADRRTQLVLEAAPKTSSPTILTGGIAGTIWRSLGVRVTPLAAHSEVIRSHPKLNGGMLINEVRPDSPAAKAGLKIGDVLVGLHQWEMLTPDNINYVLTHPERHSFATMQFYILRAGQVHRGWITPVD